jgi:hypothetical protein
VTEDDLIDDSQSEPRIADALRDGTSGNGAAGWADDATEFGGEDGLAAPADRGLKHMVSGIA